VTYLNDTVKLVDRKNSHFSIRMSDLPQSIVLELQTILCSELGVWKARYLKCVLKKLHVNVFFSFFKFKNKNVVRLF